MHAFRRGVVRTDGLGVTDVFVEEAVMRSLIEFDLRLLPMLPVMRCHLGTWFRNDLEVLDCLRQACFDVLKSRNLSLLILALRHGENFVQRRC